MKYTKKIICGFVVLTTVLSQACFLPVAKDVYANDTNVNVNLKVGKDYIIDNGNITDDADGSVISMENCYDSFTKLYNHISDVNNSLTSFSSTANADISLSDASFEFTFIDDKESYSRYKIYNKKTNQYLIQTSAATYFGSAETKMRVSKVGDYFRICNDNGTRYTMFYVNKMLFDSNGNDGNTNTDSFKYDVTLFEKKDSISSTDIIPGYQKATSIESGKSYLITIIYNGNVFLLYPTNTTASQSKLVKSSFYDLYNIGSTTPNTDTIEQNHISITKTDTGYTLKSGEKYMNNIGNGSILTTDAKYFEIENGKSTGNFYIKTTGDSNSNNNGRYYVFHYASGGFKLNAMKGYDQSWDGITGDYNWMIFEKTDTLDINSLVPGYIQVTDLDNISTDKQYILVYEKESGEGSGTYIVNISGNNQNTNGLRKLVNRKVQLSISGLQIGKDTVVVDGITYNFTVVKNLARGKTPIVKWSDGSSQTANSGVENVTDGTIDTNKYIDFGKDNDTRGSYLEVDLGQVSLISQIDLYRYWKDGRTYRNTVVAVSNDPSFYNYKVIYNTDSSNVNGLGAGNDSTYAESSAGKTLEFDETTARYVRVYMNGQNDSKTTNHIVELEVYGYETLANEITTDTLFNTRNNTYAGNYLFEGYYADGEGTTPVTRTDFTSNTDYFAKYVNPKVLTMKAQSKIDEDRNVDVRFISSVGSANLENVKFKIEILDANNTVTKTGTIKTTKAYKSIVADEITLSNPSSVFDNTASQLFVACKLNNIPETSASSKVRVTPYWLPNGYADEEKNYVQGESRKFDVQDFFEHATETIKGE